MIYNALSTLVKFTLVAVVLGGVLGAFDLTATEILKDLGLAPNKLSKLAQEAFQWAVPHFVLGAMVIIPIWLVIFLLKPPRMGK